MSGCLSTVAAMNARKYAWKILHAEIRRQCGADEGLDFHPQLKQQGALFKEARDQRISEYEIAVELANLGATYAAMTENPLEVAKQIETKIMAEPDGTCWPENPAEDCEGCPVCEDDEDWDD